MRIAGPGQAGTGARNVGSRLVAKPLRAILQPVAPPGCCAAYAQLPILLPSLLHLLLKAGLLVLWDLSYQDVQERRMGRPARTGAWGMGEVAMSPGEREQHGQQDRPRRWAGPRALLRVVLALFFIGAGLLHFLRPSAYVQIVPPYLPWPLALVYVSGACEVLGGTGLLVPGLRRAAGWGLMALLVAVFPANLHMALGDVSIQGLSIPPLLLWLRLPLQLVLMAWVYWCSGDSQPGSRNRAAWTTR